jgi:serine/threonine-protein kinase RIO1
MAVRRGREEWKIYGNVFDKFTKELLFKLASQGYFDELQTASGVGERGERLHRHARTTKRQRGGCDRQDLPP